MKIIVPDIVQKSIDDFKRKDVREVALKIYCALYKLNLNKNTITGWFDVPSSYLVAINKNYQRTIKKFIADGIIKFYTRPLTDPQNVFNEVHKKYYNKTWGICMKYKFLIDVEIGTEIEIDGDNPNNKRWFDILKKSLIALGYEPKIKRDDFGRRVHHPAIYDYKTNLKGKGLHLIDAKCSQPRLLYLLMKEKGVYDKAYFDIFDKGFDFYLILQNKLTLKNRDEAKDLFMYWLNSEKYVPNKGIYSLFREASNFIQGLKTRNYKDAASYLQRREAKIWIDDLLENLPASFALPVHDCLIVKNIDVPEVLTFMRSKYPQIEFQINEL
jgi:hypothetical protein